MAECSIRNLTIQNQECIIEGITLTVHDCIEATINGTIEYKLDKSLYMYGNRKEIDVLDSMAEVDEAVGMLDEAIFKLTNYMKITNKIECDEIIFWGNVKIERTIEEVPQFFAIPDSGKMYSLYEIGEITENDIAIKSIGTKLSSDELIERLETLSPGIIHSMVNEKFNEDYNQEVQGTMNEDILGHMNADIQGTMNGDICGDMDGDIHGTMNGDICGDMDGDIHGMMNGDVCGDMNGDIYGMMSGDVCGDMNGNICGTMSGDIHGNMYGDVYGIFKGKLHGKMLGTIHKS